MDKIDLSKKTGGEFGLSYPPLHFLSPLDEVSFPQNLFSGFQ